MPRGFDGNVTINQTINALISKITGQWKGRTAGGCANNRETWPDNPRFKLVIDSPSQIQVSCQLVWDRWCTYLNSWSFPWFSLTMLRNFFLWKYLLFMIFKIYTYCLHDSLSYFIFEINKSELGSEAVVCKLMVSALLRLSWRVHVNSRSGSTFYA